MRHLKNVKRRVALGCLTVTCGLYILSLRGGVGLRDQATTWAAPAPSPTVVGFDDSPAGTRITTQYPGVVFAEGGVILAASDVGLATRSSPNLLTKQCAEFDEPPFTIHFVDPQALVRVYVGNPTPFSQKAVLRAYDSSVAKGNLVGSADVTLGPRAAITTPLEICRALEGDIRRVELELENSTCELIDDLTFLDQADLGPIAAVNFDERLEFARITRQYSGLNFIDGPWVRRASSLGTTTISPPNLLEQFPEIGGEFDPGPLRVVLDPPQAWVRAHVGNSDGFSPRRVEMRAYASASGGAPVATVFANLGAAAAVRTPLEICRLAEGDIRRIEVLQEAEGFERIDDFQFAGMPPPPPLPDPQPPEVFIDLPRDGDFFFGELIDLEGRIRENVGLQQVILTQEQLDGPGRREDGTFVRFVRGGAPSFAFDSSLRLFPGRNRIRIQAFDISGNPSSNPESEVVVTLAPRMEVTIHVPVFDPRRAPPLTSSAVTVLGSVRKAFGTLPRERLRVLVQSLSAGSRAPTPVDVVLGGPPLFSFRATVPLLSGRVDELNTITVVAESEDGETAEDSVAVLFSLPDLSVKAVDVRQAAEGSLVADKQTVVRVYPQRARWAGGGDVTVRRVELFGRRGGVDLPGSPLTRDLPVNAIFEGASTEALRMAINSSWNIVLPSSWDDAGELELLALVNGDGEVTECGSCTRNNELRTVASFTTRNAFNVVPVLLSVNGSALPAASTIGPSFRAIQRLYPTPTVNIRPSRTLTLNSADFRDLNRRDGMGNPTDDADDAMEELAERIADQYTCYDGEWYGFIFDRIDGCEWDTFFYGMIAGGNTARVGTAVDIDAPAAWGIAGLSLSAAAHELGHCLGRLHAPGHGEGGSDDRFPDRHGGIRRPGFDTVALQVIPPLRGAGWPSGVPTVSDGGGLDMNHAHDFMSYGAEPSWISPYTWRALFQKNFRGERSFSLTARGVTSAGATEEERRFLAVRGRLRDGRVSVLQPFQVATLPQGVVVETGDGSYRVEAQDASGSPLATARFEPTDLTEGGSGRLKKFKAVLPFPAGASQVVLIDPEGLVIAQRPVSPNEPVVRLVHPNGGEVWTANDIQTIAWNGSDSDGDALSYTIQYSKDGGATWQMIVSQLIETSYDVDVSSLAGSDRAKVRVIASDGVHSARDESDGTFTIEGKPPQVVVFSPQDGVLLNLREPFSFEGAATDHEDGDLIGATLVWSSDIDGDLGSGTRVEVSELSPGAHTILLSATDSDGLRGEASVSVNVLARAVKESVGSLDGWVDSAGATETQGRIAVGNGALVDPSGERRIRGFLSFDLGLVPAGSEVVEARLELYQGAVTGTPYRAQAADREALRTRRIRIDRVDYGPQLNAEDFDTPALGLELGTVTDNGLLQYKTLDVREAVKKAVEEGRPLVQFRLRLVEERDGDGHDDVAEFESSSSAGPAGNAPRLVIVYALPN